MLESLKAAFPVGMMFQHGQSPEYTVVGYIDPLGYGWLVACTKPDHTITTFSAECLRIQYGL